MKHTELKTDILEDKLPPAKVVQMMPADFMSEDKRK
jgi:hypothetical protein